MSIISWLTAFIEFLNSNNGIITALATALLAYITCRYVRLMKTYVQLTEKNVQMTQETVENSYKPEIVLRLLRKGTRSVRIAPTEFTEKSTFILSVKNVGPGIAYKIKFQGNLSFQPYKSEYHKSEYSLKSINFLRNGIDQLVAGEERRSIHDFIGDPSGDPNQL